jgi:ubiquinol-cytochrome c reductase cytochrome b subunit
MFRGLMYGSYRKPRELLWIIGMVIYLALMAEAFMGYLLPWGQMSFWGAQVIVNLFSSVPYIGPDLAILIRGDYVVSDATLNRFFALHVIAVPMVLIGIVFVHIVALHAVGSNNPDGIEIKKNKDANGHPVDGIPFFPYMAVKDAVAAVAFLIIFSAVVFFAPEINGYFLEANNFVPANPMKTPVHIAPVWYFTPYYAILRAVPPLFGSQFPGVVAMGVATMIFFALPWLDRGKVKSIRYRGPIYKSFLAAFVVSFIGLGWLGLLPSTPTYTWIARVLSVVYFAFFFLMPWYTKIDKCKPEPDRLTSK